MPRNCARASRNFKIRRRQTCGPSGSANCVNFRPVCQREIQRESQHAMLELSMRINGYKLQISQFGHLSGLAASAINVAQVSAAHFARNLVLERDFALSKITRASDERQEEFYEESRRSYRPLFCLPALLTPASLSNICALN